MTAAPALRLRRIAAEEEESEDSEQMESRATPLLAVLPSGVKPAKTKAAAATKQAAPTTARTSRAAAAAPGHGKQRGKREAGDGGGESSGLPRIERRPTLLVLAGALLPLPLESCPSLRHLRYIIVKDAAGQDHCDGPSAKHAICDSGLPFQLQSLPTDQVAAKR